MKKILDLPSIPAGMLAQHCLSCLVASLPAQPLPPPSSPSLHWWLYPPLMPNIDTILILFCYSIKGILKSLWQNIEKQINPSYG